jgi:hypothetical protein
VVEITRPAEAPEPALPRGCRLAHEWFSGWRWEHYRSGVLQNESLNNFETREECVADALRHLLRAPATPASGRAAAPEDEQEATAVAA